MDYLDYLDTFSAFAAELDFAALPAAVQEQVRWIVADTVAAIVAGSAEPELRALAAKQTSPGMASLLGLGRAASADAAALINGTAGTFLEMDEGNRFSKGHPAIHVVPAALALCQERGLDAGVFLSAVVTGYEVGSRLGAAVQLRAAMHPHGTWGTVGAAAACARVAGLAAPAMREAINIGASLTTATSKKTMLEGGLVRNVYAGLSNRSGLLALQLAESGFTGERDGLVSLFGAIVSERFDTAVLLRDLGRDWHLMHNYFKLHSCCRYNHGTLDAIDAMAARGPLPQVDQIAQVQVDSYGYAAELNDKAPRNTLAAKFSVPFAVATRLVNGSSALASFTWDAVRDPRVLALAQRVDVREDPTMSRRLPLERPARVVITLHDGSRLEGEVGVNRGDDASPYSRDELRGKFMDLTTRVWPAAHAERVLKATLALGIAGDLPGVSLGDWAALLQPGPAA
ncbi:MAG: MmgE/PrpD family protein [Rhodoferax sp.]|nr:MmgE/PrpD family protein [Rhodoferax sp.]